MSWRREEGGFNSDLETEQVVGRGKRSYANVKIELH